VKCRTFGEAVVNRKGECLGRVLALGCVGGELHLDRAIALAERVELELVGCAGIAIPQL
jgi:hypothetical protein